MFRWSIVVAVAMTGCANAGANVPVPGKTEPAAWMAGEPNAWASVDLRGLRADPTYGPVLQCPAAPPAAPPKTVPGALGALPCRDALKQAERADAWIVRDAQGMQSELLVFHKADAAVACLDTEAKGAPLGPNVTEAVRTGNRWPRVYVVKSPRGVDVVFPTGTAVARTRDAFVRGVEAPMGEALPGGVLARFAGDTALLKILDSELPSNATLNLGGLKSAELTIETTVKNPGQFAYGIRARFDFPSQADRLDPAFNQIAIELRRAGHVVEVGRTDSWSFHAHVRSPSNTIATSCRPAP